MAEEVVSVRSIMRPESQLLVKTKDAYSRKDLFRAGIEKLLWTVFSFVKLLKYLAVILMHAGVCAVMHQLRHTVATVERVENKHLSDIYQQYS